MEQKTLTLSVSRYTTYIYIYLPSIQNNMWRLARQDTMLCAPHLPTLSIWTSAVPSEYYMNSAVINSTICYELCSHELYNLLWTLQSWTLQSVMNSSLWFKGAYYYSRPTNTTLQTSWDEITATLTLKTAFQTFHTIIRLMTIPYLVACNHFCIL